MIELTLILIAILLISYYIYNTREHFNIMQLPTSTYTCDKLLSHSDNNCMCSNGGIITCYSNGNIDNNEVYDSVCP